MRRASSAPSAASLPRRPRRDRWRSWSHWVRREVAPPRENEKLPLPEREPELVACGASIDMNCEPPLSSSTRKRRKRRERSYSSSSSNSSSPSETSVRSG